MAIKREEKARKSKESRNLKICETRNKTELGDRLGVLFICCEHE